MKASWAGNLSLLAGCLLSMAVLAADPLTPSVTPSLEVSALPARSNCQLLERERQSLQDDAFSQLGIRPVPANSRIAELVVIRQPVFAKAEYWWQRLANRYHWPTREAVVRQVLPFASGDLVDTQQLAEAERILRSKPYYFDGRLMPIARCPAGLLLAVVVRDVWTLNPRLILTRNGGDNDLGAGISDTNWFGTGVAASIGYLRSDERSGVNAIYRDANVAGTRWSLDSHLYHANDGGFYQASLARPFYAEQIESSVGGSVTLHQRDQGLYFLEDKVWELDARTRQAELYAGRLIGFNHRQATRLFAGLAYDDHQLRAPTGFPDRVEDRRFLYPFVGWQRLSRRFSERKNIDRVQRTEDLSLGSRAALRLGYSAGWGGGERNVWLLNGSYRYQDWWAKRWLLRVDGNVGGRWHRREGEVRDLRAGVRVAAQHHQHEQWRLLVRAQARYAKNLSIDQQLVIGGRTGLRGYPNRYQVGDRSLLLTVEERFYANRYPLQMFRLGAAMFVDVGRAWYEDDEPNWIPQQRRAKHFDTLANVGFGLRLESTRTRRDRVMHIDFAVPLVKGLRVRSLEITLEARQSL